MTERVIEILLVEDNNRDVNLTLEALQNERLKDSIEVARDGEAALDFIFCRGQYSNRTFNRPPRLILLDLKLPDISGLEVLNAVKGDPRTKAIPVVILTASQGEQDLIEGYKLGVNAYIQKPDDIYQFAQFVKQLRMFWLVVNQPPPPGAFAGKRGEFSTMEANRSSLNDITERRQAEGEAPRKSETNYHSLVEGSPYGIFRSTPDGRFLMVNPALVRMLGCDSEAELLRKDIARDVYMDPADRRRIHEEVEKVDRFEGLELQWKRKDGLPIIVRSTGRLIRDEKGRTACFEIIAEDVTERKGLEAQLREAHKMEAIGQLAGGIAHDFGNLLFVILGETELALKQTDPADRSYTRLKEIQQAAEHSRWLIAQLLILGRRQAIEAQVIDLNTSVRETRQLFERLIGEDILVTTVLSPVLGRVKADRGLIQQMIMNLAVNARDAMPIGGKLTIETENVNLDDSYARQHPGTRPGPYVMLAVSDTGSGMDAKTRSRIFEPFFTTKGPGKGTGLGLAMTQSIVAQSGGQVFVQSEPGHGSTFRVYLPRVDEELHAPHLEKKGEAPPCGSETVLLVEDAQGVRILIRESLTSAGYIVLVAENGQVAVEVAQRHPGLIHLLLTDVVMPEMSGQTLAGCLTTKRPEMKVLYMSGYSSETVLRHGVLATGAALLQKPFTLDDLARKVREVLGGKQP